MILPPLVNKAYLFTRKYYLDIAGNWAVPQPGVHLLNGHILHGDNNATNEHFHGVLKQLSKKVEFIAFDEAAELIQKRKISTRHTLVAISYDDGYEECFTKIKPALDDFGIKAAFFINPNYVDGTPEYIADFLKNRVFMNSHKLPMNWEQITQLHTEGHLIGAHTLNHINCRTTPTQELDYELSTCKKIIEEKLGTACEHFAYTYGKIEHFSEEALAVAEKYYRFIYSQAGHKDYFSYNGRVINRRHFECYWPASHIAYYLEKNLLVEA